MISYRQADLLERIKTYVTFDFCESKQDDIYYCFIYDPKNIIEKAKAVHKIDRHFKVNIFGREWHILDVPFENRTLENLSENNWLQVKETLNSFIYAMNEGGYVATKVSEERINREGGSTYVCKFSVSKM